MHTNPSTEEEEAEFGTARTRLRLVASLLAFSPLLGLPVCPPHLASRIGKALQSTKVKGKGFAWCQDTDHELPVTVDEEFRAP